jgi:hypothetical protein
LSLLLDSVNLRKFIFKARLAFEKIPPCNKTLKNCLPCKSEHYYERINARTKSQARKEKKKPNYPEDICTDSAGGKDKCIKTEKQIVFRMQTDKNRRQTKEQTNEKKKDEKRENK